MLVACQERTIAAPRELIIWGRQPPPLGGVTAAFRDWTRTPSERFGQNVTFARLDSRRTIMRLVPRILAGNATSLFNVSQWARIAAIGRLRWCIRGGWIAFLHSGTLIESWHQMSAVERDYLTDCLRDARAVWVTNASIADSTFGDAVEYEVVSPHVRRQERQPQDAVHDPLDASAGIDFVTSAYGADDEIYQYSTAAGVVRSLRERGIEARLDVLIYGECPPDALARARKVGCPPIIRVYEQLEPQEALRYLENSDALLRLTTADGDSGIVRQAISLGTRVIASDLVPRPPGCALVDISKPLAAIVDEVMSGLGDRPRLSDGAGLGKPFDEAVFSYQNRG